MVGRKRHLLTNTDGRLLIAAVSPADLYDTRGAVALLRSSRRPWPSLARRYADQAYADQAHQGERVGTAMILVKRLARALWNRV